MLIQQMWRRWTQWSNQRRRKKKKKEKRKEKERMQMMRLLQPMLMKNNMLCSHVKKLHTRVGHVCPLYGCMWIMCCLCVPECMRVVSVVLIICGSKCNTYGNFTDSFLPIPQTLLGFNLSQMMMMRMEALTAPLSAPFPPHHNTHESPPHVTYNLYTTRAHIHNTTLALSPRALSRIPPNSRALFPRAAPIPQPRFPIPTWKLCWLRRIRIMTALWQHPCYLPPLCCCMS